jgi:hypothetical protein
MLWFVKFAEYSDEHVLLSKPILYILALSESVSKTCLSWTKVSVAVPGGHDRASVLSLLCVQSMCLNVRILEIDRCPMLLSGSWKQALLPFGDECTLNRFFDLDWYKSDSVRRFNV